MPIQRGEVKTSIGLANPKQPISRLHPIYDSTGTLIAIEVEVLALFSDGTVEGTAIDLIPLLTAPQRTTLTNILTAITNRVQGELQ